MSRKRETEGNGGDRDRTDDPLLAKQVLSQLSYTPSEQAPSARDHKAKPPFGALLPPGDFLLVSASQPHPAQARGTEGNGPGRI